MTAWAIRVQDREVVKAFAQGLGLPSPFLDLHILGLAAVVKAENVTPRNKELIFRFLNHISPEVSEFRLSFYAHKLRRIASWLGKDFDAAGEEDIRAVVTFVSKGNAQESGKRYSEASIHGFKVTLKRFYRWLEGDEEEYPRKVRWIKTSGDTTRIHEPEQLLTFEEILAMIGRARNPRDKAMISFLYESGARVGEMLAMRIRHVEFMPTVVRVTLPVSKTRPRVIPLVSCAQHLATWINYHPLKDDQEALLWTNMKYDFREALETQTVGEILKAAARDAGIRKRVYPHLFRACSITQKHRQGWPEQAVKLFHGLSKDSHVMKHYSHLSYDDLEQIQKRTNGLEVEKKDEPTGLIRCRACGRQNALYIERCACGLPTEMKVLTGEDRTQLIETQVATQVDRRIRDLAESRGVHDRMMERFMSALLEKSLQSPELRKVIGELGASLPQKQRPAPPVEDIPVTGSGSGTAPLSTRRPLQTSEEN